MKLQPAQFNSKHRSQTELDHTNSYWKAPLIQFPF